MILAQLTFIHTAVLGIQTESSWSGRKLIFHWLFLPRELPSMITAGTRKRICKFNGFRGSMGQDTAEKVVIELVV